MKKIKPTIILVRPQLSENIGMAARAMDNFGLSKLSIVNPRDGWPSKKAENSAKHAKKIINRAKVYESLEEAFERTGVKGTRTGYQLRSARRSLNIMFQEWGNRGVHLWKVKLVKVPLVEGQAEYSFAADSENFPYDIDTVLEAYYRNNTTTTAPQDIALTKIDSKQRYNLWGRSCFIF